MINKVILIGNLGADPKTRYAEPETRYTESGTAVSNFRIATVEKYKDKEETEWHSIVTFGKLAEICGEYLRKGSKVYLEGKIRTRKWEDRDGNTRYTTEILAREMKMLSPRKQEDYSHPNPDNDDVPF